MVSSLVILFTPNIPAYSLATSFRRAFITTKFYPFMEKKKIETCLYHVYWINLDLLRVEEIRREKSGTEPMTYVFL